MKVLNLEPKEYSIDAVHIIQSCAEYCAQEMDRNNLLNQVDKYDIIIVRLAHQIDEEILNAANKLKFIVSATTGLNHIDVKYAESKGIQVLSLKGETEFLDTICATAEHTMGLILSLLRNIPAAVQSVRNEQWDRNVFKGQELFAKTVGILGYGRLGKKVAKYCKAFGARVIATDVLNLSNDDVATLVSLQTLLKESDILSIHLPYNQDTFKYLDRACFNSMRDGCLLINTSRGEVLCEDALFDAIKNKKIAGAAIDVLQGEYSNNKSWVQADRLIHYAKHNDNVIITPHIGGATKESMERTEIFMAKKLKEHIVAGL